MIDIHKLEVDSQNCINQSDIKQEDKQFSIYDYDIGNFCSDVVISPDIYAKYKTDIAAQCERDECLDFVLVKCTGILNFIHFSEVNNIVELHPSIESADIDYTFGNGIYCYAESIDIERWPNCYMYRGTWVGEYLICIYDSNHQKEGEICIKTSEYIPVQKYIDTDSYVDKTE